MKSIKILITLLLLIGATSGCATMLLKKSHDMPAPTPPTQVDMDLNGDGIVQESEAQRAEAEFRDDVEDWQSQVTTTYEPRGWATSFLDVGGTLGSAFGGPAVGTGATALSVLLAGYARRKTKQAKQKGGEAEKNGLTARVLVDNLKLVFATLEASEEGQELVGKLKNKLKSVQLNAGVWEDIKTVIKKV